MAYLLQPGLQQIESPKVLPPNCATEVVMNPPEPSNLNYCCRPNTMIWGTAPFKAGKGAPNDLVMVADELRPQSTTQFGKLYVNNSSGKYFPIQNMECSQPLRTMKFEPASTRAQVQNGLFQRRYC